MSSAASSPAKVASTDSVSTSPSPYDSEVDEVTT
jgi:hypothetical protein